MSWSLGSKLDVDGGVFWVSQNGPAHFLRAFTGLYHFDLAQRAKQIWSYPLQDDHAFSYKTVVITDQAIITTTHRNKKSDNVWLVALHPESGKLLWERRLVWRLNNDLGGVYGAGRRVAFIEDPKKPQLFVLDAASGEVVHTAKGVKPFGGALSQHSAQYGALLDKWLYYAVEGDGLYRADLSSAKPELERIIEDDIRAVVDAAPYLYLQQSTSSGLGLVLIDGKTGQEQARMLLPTDWQVDNVRPALPERLGQVFVFLADKGGLALVDIKQQRVCWHIGVEEAWQVYDVADTPHAAVATVFAGDSKQMITINTQNGEWQPLSEHPPADTLYWTGKQLISSSAFETLVLCWKEK